MPLAVAVTDAEFTLVTMIGAEDVDSVAEAPLTGVLTNRMTPPVTGSSESLAVKITASGLVNAPPFSAVCGLPPGTTVRVKPWLSKAPISTLPNRLHAALVGGWDAGADGPAADRRAAGHQGHGLGRPAVVAQGSQPWDWPLRRGCR